MTLEHRLALAFLTERPAQAAMMLEQLPLDARVDVLRAAPQASAGVLREMSTSAAAEALARLEPAEAIDALDGLPADVTGMLLRRMPPARMPPVLALMSADRQREVRRALQYPEGTAGALMDPAVMSLPDDITTADARIRLRHEGLDALSYLYVVDRAGRLVGVVGLVALLRTRGRSAIRAVMQPDVERLSVQALGVDVLRHPAWRSFHALPVVDEENRLVGVMRYRTLRQLERDAEARQVRQPASLTIAAMGELFHLGLAAFVEGVATVSGPTGRRGGDGVRGGGPVGAGR